MFALALSTSASAQDTTTRPSVLLLVPADAWPASPLAEALALELASRGLALVVRTDDTAGTLLERAAMAQQLARTHGTLAAVLVDRGVEGGSAVRVVGADGEIIRNAPLPRPLAEIEPRSFALVAASLLDELDGSLDPELRVRVELFVDGNGRPVQVQGALGDGVTAAPVPAPPPAVAPPPPPPPPPPPARPMVDEGSELPDLDLPILPRTGFVLEAGAASALVWNGVSVAFDGYLTDSIRLGVLARAGIVPDGAAGSFGVHLVFVEGEASARFDHGPELSLVAADKLTGALLGYQIGYAWELEAGVALGVRLTGGIAIAQDPLPFALLTVFTELPLG